ncbi:unnamed protein product [Effrenium voratum]|uniref:Uncharacterized protein n=1 Tax=Effrenium voratum TaxID=2562239 RepID=A0AA36MGE8_9DINO|nr:unnamed protein product [Effrenium voratum]
MSAALRLGAIGAFLDQVQNVGQMVEIGQSHVHQQEQIRWARRAYQLESQSVRLDVFDHVKEEIRSHHDTYMGRIDALLLVLALVWPFGLNTIQFSDPFVPQTEMECEDCIEVQYTWLVGAWIMLLGMILILPFWGILMLIRCKLKLDRWLEYSLARLNQARRGMNIAPPKEEERDEEEEHDDTKEIVCCLVNMVAECQEYLALIWTEECGWLVQTSTTLLWLSATAALMLTAESVWVFMFNKGSSHATWGNVFACLVLFALVLPAVYVLRQRSWEELEPPSGHGEELSLAQAVSSKIYLEEAEARRKRAILLRGNSSANLGTPLLRTSSEKERHPDRGQLRLGWLFCARRKEVRRNLPGSPLISDLRAF